MKNSYNTLPLLTEAEKKELSTKKLRIALISEDVESHYILNIIQGITKAIADFDISMIIISGKALNSPDPFEENENFIYSLAHSPNIDGIIISSSSLETFSSKQQLDDFAKSFSPLPLVCIGSLREGTTSLTIENYHGMKDLISHFIEGHAKKKIAFIKGRNSNDAVERFQAYCDALQEHGLAFDPKLVVNGDFFLTSGILAVEELYKTRKLLPDCIIAANDHMALGAIIGLEQMSLKVPQDVAVGGFDDMPEVRFSPPPLSTVKQPVELMGYQATNILLSKILGRDDTESYTITSFPVLRQSCGCYYQPLSDISNPEDEKVDSARRYQALYQLLTSKSELPQAIQRALTEKSHTLLKEVLTFIEEPSECTRQQAAATFTETVTKAGNTHEFIVTWQHIVSRLEKKMFSLYDGKKELYRIIEIFQLFRVELIRLDQKINGNSFLKALAANESARLLDASIFRSTNIDLLLSDIETFMPAIDCSSVYISLFDSDSFEKNRFSETATLLLSLSKGKRDPFEKKTYKTELILPDEIIRNLEKNILIATPTCFQENQFGFLVNEFIPGHSTHYKNLNRQIANIFKKHCLFQERDKAEAKLEETIDSTKVINRNLVDTIETIENTKEKLIETEKLAALGDLVAGIAHEVNTPLGTTLLTVSHLQDLAHSYIKLYESSKLKRSDFEKLLDQSKELGELIINNLMRASEMITNFKQIAVDQTSYATREFDLGNYIQDTINSLRSLIKKTSHSIDSKLPESIIVESFPGAVSQLVSNLIINALTHGFDSLSNKTVEVLLYENQDDACIEVSDNGLGIAPENMDKIFTPFFTTKRDSGGSGLGLQIVYNLVTQKLHGSIRCESSPNEGTTFFIRFPKRRVENTTK